MAIEAVSTRFEAVPPLEKFPSLFAQFAYAPANAKGIREFANKFGLPAGASGSVTTMQRLDVILKQQATLKRALELFEKDDKQSLSKLLHNEVNYHVERYGHSYFDLQVDEDGKFTTAIVPTHFIQALWIQFMWHAASDLKLFRCEHCGKPFSVGTGTKRRRTSKYCDKPCKVAAFRSKKGK